MPVMVPVERGRLWAEWTGDEAASGPGIVLLHSALADARMWDPQWAALSAARRTVRYDLRGFGRSEGDVDGYSSRRDLLAVMDAAGLERAVLVGSSMGGGVAIDAAIEVPDRVAGVVWTGGGLSGLEVPDTPAEAAADAEARALADRRAWSELAELNVAVFVDGLGQPRGRAAAAAREAIQRMLLDLLVAERPRRRPLPLEPPAALRLAALQAPLLVIVGLLDTPTTLAAADVLVAGVGDVRRVDVPGAAHFPSLEQPEWFADQVSAFVDAIAGR